MAPILKRFRATVGAAGSEREYFFLQNPNSYEGSLDTATGIKTAADSEQDMPVTSVASLLQAGVLFRIVVQYTVGTARRSSRLLVTREKLGTALDELIGKTFRGGTITSARIPRKATFF